MYNKLRDNIDSIEARLEPKQYRNLLKSVCLSQNCKNTEERQAL